MLRWTLFAIAIAVASVTPSAWAQQAAPEGSSAAAPAIVETPKYAIEFRARQGFTVGHAFVIFGELDGKGNITKSRIAGLRPAGDDQACEGCSGVAFAVGLVVPVPAVWAGPGDRDEGLVTARHRVVLTPQAYAKVVAKIRSIQARVTTWHSSYHCVHFVRDLAEYMGLNLPATMMPQSFVAELHERNKAGVANIASAKASALPKLSDASKRARLQAQ